ncbi:MAG: hypothetical protein KKF44_10960 [Nanoarchaeota archaeon]|nr:hypothetical protein [Nanoarchaeota archaeon]
MLVNLLKSMMEKIPWPNSKTDSSVLYSLGKDGSEGLDVVVADESNRRYALIDGNGNENNPVFRAQIEKYAEQLLQNSPKELDPNIREYEFIPENTSFALVEWNTDGTIDYAVKDAVLIGWKKKPDKPLEAEIIYMPKHFDINSKENFEINKGKTDESYLFSAAFSDGYIFLNDESLMGDVEGYSDEIAPVFLEGAVMRTLGLDSDYEMVLNIIIKPLTALLSEQYSSRTRISSKNSEIKERFDKYFSQKQEIGDDISMILSESPLIKYR